MKINKIAGICKKSKTAFLFEKTNGGIVQQQFISDGGVIYPINGLPYLQEEYIFTIFGVPEKDKEKWYFKQAELPEHINMDDTDATERRIDPETVSIYRNGNTLTSSYYISGRRQIRKRADSLHGKLRYKCAERCNDRTAARIRNVAWAIASRGELQRGRGGIG